MNCINVCINAILSNGMVTCLNIFRNLVSCDKLEQDTK